MALGNKDYFVFLNRVIFCFFLPCVRSERTYEGGRAAIPVRPEEAASRGTGRRAERAPRSASFTVSQPFSLPQENQCKSHSRIKLLVHYLALSGLLVAEGNGTYQVPYLKDLRSPSDTYINDRSV